MTDPKTITDLTTRNDIGSVATPYIPYAENGADFKIDPRVLSGGVVNVLQKGAVGDGVNDDTVAIQDAIDLVESNGGGVVFFPWGQYVITSLSVPDTVSLHGVGRTSRYANASSRTEGSRIIASHTSGACITVTGTLLNGIGAEIRGLSFSTDSTYASTGGRGSLSMIKLVNTFMLTIADCAFGYCNVGYAIDGITSAGNALNLHDCTFVHVGDTTTPLIGVTGGYTYGEAANLASCADSNVYDCFIERCGQYAIRIGSNSKVQGCFIDLNDRGIYVVGDRGQIQGNSIKFNRKNAIFFDTNAGNTLIDANVLTGNNYANATGNSADTLAVRLTSGQLGVIISNNDMIDPGTWAGHPSKTQKQGAIHMGAAGNRALIRGNKIGAPATGGQRIYDPNGNLATCVVCDTLDESGNPRDAWQPEQYASATALGSVIGKVPLWDSNGSLVGYAPVYDTIT